MSALESFASRPESQKLGLTLLHFLWQGGAVALLAALTVFTLRLNRGGPRYAAYLIAMSIMAACPIVTYCLIDAPPAIDPPPIVISASQVEGLSSAIELNTTPPPPAVKPKLDAPVLLRRSLPWTLAAWSVGVALLSLRLFLGVIGVQRWKRSAEGLPAHLRARSACIASHLGLDGFTGVYLSRLVRQAVAIGCWRPMVLLPAAMATGMHTDLLEAVIAHELAHIRRKDLWINFLQRLAETLLFYHPAVWWVSARIREEREMCCDDLAVSATGKRFEYASALAEAARWQASPGGTLALGIRGGGRLLTRVQRILGVSDQPRRSAWPAGLAALAVVILVTLLASFPRPATADDTAAAKDVTEKPQLAGESPAGPRLDADVEAALRQDVEFADSLKELARINQNIAALEAAGLGDSHRDLIKARRTARQIEEYLAQRRADMRVELDHRRNVAMSRDVDRYVEEQADKDALINALRQQLASTEVQRIIAEAQGSGPDAAAYQRLSATAKLLADRLGQREQEIRKLAEARIRERQKQGGNPISFTPPRDAPAGQTPPAARQLTRPRADAETDLKELRIKLEIARVQIDKRKALLEQAHAGGSVTETRIAEAELKQAELEAELTRINLERAERALKQ